MAGLGIHGGDHPVPRDPPCEAIGLGLLVNEPDARAGNDPEETRGSAPGGIEGTLVVCERSPAALDRCGGIAHEDRIDEPLVVVVDGGRCPPWSSSSERGTEASFAMSLLARFAWDRSSVMVSLGDHGIDTHGGLTHPLGVGATELCLVDDPTGQVKDEPQGPRALDAAPDAGEHRGR